MHVRSWYSMLESKRVLFLVRSRISHNEESIAVICCVDVVAVLCANVVDLSLGPKKDSKMKNL